MSGKRLVAVGAALATRRVEQEVLDAFAKLGVESIVMKGPALAAWLGDTERISTDVDLLVRPGDVPAAHRVLGDLGYRRLLQRRQLEPDSVASTWQRAPSAVRVDLHWSVRGAASPAAGVVDALRLHTEQYRQDESASTLVLAGAARLMLLALHAAQHGAEERSTVHDLAAGLQIGGQSEWREAAQLAHQVDAVDAFAAGLRLTVKGSRLADALALPSQLTPAVALRAASAPHTALGIERLMRADSHRARLRILKEELAPPTAFMRDWHPLARRVPGGLAFLYVYRPFWLAVKAVPGYLAWRRARRRSAESLR